MARLILNNLRQKLQINTQKANFIEQQVLEQFLDYQKKLQTYEKAYQEIIMGLKKLNENFDDTELKQLQQKLGLKTEDVTSIETKLNQFHTDSLPILEEDEKQNKKVSTVSNYPSEVTKNPPLDLDFINSCKKELALFVGPMASFIVEDVTSKFPHLTKEQLIEALAKEIPNPQQANDFIAKFK